MQERQIYVERRLITVSLDVATSRQTGGLLGAWNRTQRSRHCPAVAAMAVVCGCTARKCSIYDVASGCCYRYERGVLGRTSSKGFLSGREYGQHRI